MTLWTCVSVPSHISPQMISLNTTNQLNLFWSFVLQFLCYFGNTWVRCMFTCFYLHFFCLDIYELGTYNSNYAPRERTSYKMFMLLDEEANPVTHKDHPTQ